MARRRHRLVVDRGGAGGAGGWVLLVVVIVGAVALWLVWVIVSAVIAALATPYPWIAMAIAGLGYAGHRLAQIVRSERVGVLFFDAVAALHDGDPRAPELLGQLEHRGRGEADAMLLVAAAAASQGQHRDALSALDRASALAAGIGRLSGGLPLDFPGLPATLWFFADGWGAGSLSVARAQLRLLMGQPREVIETLRPAPMDPAYALGMSVLADAHLALGEPERAMAALGEALGAKDLAPDLERALRDRLAPLIVHRSAAAQQAAAAEEARRLAEGARRLAEAQQADAAEEARRLAEAQRRAAEMQQRQREAEAREEETLRQALDRLEGAKGLAGRRAALAWGLDRLVLPALRSRLMVEASRVEVEAVLDKVDGLKTAAAKRRHLTAALEALRADNIPDELQAQQIRWLEEALAELEG